MSTATAALGRVSRAGAAESEHTRRWPVESTALFLLSLVAYLAAADYLVLHLHFLDADAYSRVASAEYVIGSRDPHLGAIGFVWPPLPALLDIPILLLQGWFPFLATLGFAGSVEAALFSAGTVVLINAALRRSGVRPAARWIVVAAWALNPMTALYATQGTSEAPFVFFLVASMLTFIRWTESRRTIHLALLGILVGLGILVRDEFLLLAPALAIGVALCAWERGMPWRQVETTVLFYALPALFISAVWIGSQWVLMRDPLFFVHSEYGNAAQAAATSGFSASELGSFGTWQGASGTILRQTLLLMPAVLPLLVLLAAAALRSREARRPGLVLAALIVPPTLLHIWLLHANELDLTLRFQIMVVPFAMVIGIWLIRRAPGRATLAAIALAALVAVSNVSAALVMSDPQQTRDEAVAVQSVTQNIAAGNVRTIDDKAQEGMLLSQQVAAANTDHGLVALDTFLGFPIFMTAQDRGTFVVTSDEDFEAVANQPDVYHVEYFLVPQPVGEGRLDRLNVLYPTLWANGGGFAKIVADIGGSDHWRLYRIVAPTGRG